MAPTTITSIRVNNKIRDLLNAFVQKLSERYERPVSANEALKLLLDNSSQL